MFQKKVLSAVTAVKFQIWSRQTEKHVYSRIVSFWNTCCIKDYCPHNYWYSFSSMYSYDTDGNVFTLPL